MYNDDFVPRRDLAFVENAVYDLEQKVDWIVRNSVLPSLVGKAVRVYKDKDKWDAGEVISFENGKVTVFMSATMKTEVVNYLDLELA